MALLLTTTWEVRPTNGSDANNSGGFVPGSSGTDFSQQNAAQYTLTGLTTAAANAIILTATAAADMVGNIIQITGGTNFTTGHYAILSVSVGVSITVDRNCTTAAGAAGTANIGGAKQTIGAMHTILTTTNQNATGQIVWVKAEATITVGATLTFSPNGGGGIPTQLNGYTTTRGDNGRVTIQATAGSNYDCFTNSGHSVIQRNFFFDGNSRTGMSGFNTLSSALTLENCKAANCVQTGFKFPLSNCKAVRCIATACAIGFGCDSGNGANYFRDCLAYANTNVGFSTKSSSLLRCIAANNTGATVDGFGADINGNAGNASFDHCLSYANGRDGFRFGVTQAKPIDFTNNISWGNAGLDINVLTNAIPVGGITADYNLYATKSANFPAGAHDVTLTGDPTTNGGSNDFTLNNTAGAGAACRAAAFPGALEVGGTGYADGGPLQHQDSPASTTVVVNRNVTNYVEVNQGDL